MYAVALHTSLMDRDLNRTFGFCFPEQILPDELWAQKQPDNFAGLESCAMLDICDSCNNAGFHDTSCTVIAKVLCQLLIAN